MLPLVRSDATGSPRGTFTNLRAPVVPGMADVIDMLTMYPDARRKVVRMLAETDASAG